MLSGSLDNKIYFQEPTQTQSGSGKPVDSWSAFATAWADVSHKSGSEGIEGGELVGSTTIELKIRYISGLTQKMRILFNSEYYNILAILPQDRNHTILIQAKKIDHE